MKHFSGEQLIDFFISTRPRMIWEIDRETLNGIKNLRDGAGVYFWKPEPNYPDMPGTLFGLEISVAREKCFQLKRIFSNGDVHIDVPEFFQKPKVVIVGRRSWEVRKRYIQQDLEFSELFESDNSTGPWRICLEFKCSAEHVHTGPPS